MDGQRIAVSKIYYKIVEISCRQGVIAIQQAVVHPAPSHLQQPSGLQPQMQSTLTDILDQPPTRRKRWRCLLAEIKARKSLGIDL